MTDDDFNQLTELWNHSEPSPALDALQTTTAKAMRRSRLFTLLECMAAGVISLAIAAIMAVFPEPRILIMGTVILIGLAAAVSYLVHLQRSITYAENGDAHALLTTEADRIRKSIKRYEAGLYAFLPAAFLGSLLGHFIADDSARSERLAGELGALAGWPLIVLGGCALILIGCVSVAFLKREKTKLAHVETLLQELPADK